MKQITVYKCESCGFMSPNHLDVLRHEAKHYHLTPEQYRQWQQLSQKAAKAGYAVGVQKNPQTDQAFDNACRALANFEETFNLTEARKPSGFY